MASEILPLLTVVVIPACLVAALQGQNVEQAGKTRDQLSKLAVVWRASEIIWKDVRDIEGAKRSVLWGNPEKTAYGAWEKLSAGTQLPLHWHTYDARFIVLSGTLVVAFNGKPLQQLGPGSYCFLPGGLRHTKACRMAEDCVAFIMQPGVEDTNWVTEKAIDRKEGKRK